MTARRAPARTDADRARSKRRRGALALALLVAISYAAARLWQAADVERALDHAAAELAARTGLVLSHGPVHVELGRRLGIEVDEAKLADRHTDRTLFEASSLVVALELEPLMHGELRFGEILVDRPRLRGERAEDGSIDLVNALDRVLASAASERESAGEERRRRLVARVAADRIEVRGARLEWLDRRHPEGPRRAVLEPLDLTLENRRRAGALAFEASGHVIEPRTSSMPATGTTLAARGSLTGIGQVASLASAPFSVDVTVADLDVALANPWLPAALGANASLGGLAHAHASATGTWRGDVSARLEATLANPAWTVPVAWDEPQRMATLGFRAGVARRGGVWIAEDWALDGDDVEARGRAELAELDSGDPLLSVELASPWLDLERVRHRLPLVALGDTLRYLARVVDHGRGRAEEVRIRGRLSQLAHVSERANRDGVLARLGFEDVSGIPYTGLARASAVSGTLVLERGDVRLEHFTARYGDSTLREIEGTVHDVWGSTRLALATRDADVALDDLARFLASDLLPREARELTAELATPRGRARGRLRFESDFTRPPRFAGDAEIVDGAIGVPSRGWAFAGIAGAVSFDERRLTSGGLALGIGAAQARVQGSVMRYRDDPVVDLRIEARDVRAVDLERTLGVALASGRHGGRVSGTVAVRGRPRREEPLAVSGRLDVANLDVGPPFLTERLDGVTGSLVIEGTSGRFDLDSLAWHGHRSRAAGTFEDIGGAAPRVTVDGAALEPIDLERFAGGSSEPKPATRPGARSAPAPEPARLGVQGRYRAAQARYRDTAIDELAASFRYDRGILEIERATGRALGGTFDAHATFRSDRDGRLTIELEPTIRDMDAPRLLATLDVPWRALTGRADVSGHVRFGWPLASQLAALDGTLAVGLRDGRVFEAKALWKVLDLVDFSRWVTSPMDWREMGLAYDALEGELELREARVSTRGMALHGPTVDLELSGSVGLVDRSVAGVVTVAPLQLVDELLDPIPVVGDVKQALGLTSYSFRVEGTFGDVRVVPQPLERMGALWQRVVPKQHTPAPAEPTP
ncbi:MAG: AsmA-like C-terminal region-containing protein [bacterium]